MRSGGDGYRCTRCQQLFPRTAAGQHDFRLTAAARIVYQAVYAPLMYDAAIDAPLCGESPCPDVRNHFTGNVPTHLTADQISYIPAARGGEVALDLGCGSGIHRAVLESLGYTYCGVDFAGAAAQDLVDAHALPYVDTAFDLVFSVAVLEHLADPLRALSEIYRVLKRSGRFIGTVAFLEPFHDNSFFHFTHLGLWRALCASGFLVETVFPIAGWNVARAQLEMGFGPHLPAGLARVLALPFACALRVYARLGRRLARDTTRHRPEMAAARHAGAFFFVAVKPGDGPR